MLLERRTHKNDVILLRVHTFSSQTFRPKTRLFLHVLFLKCLTYPDLSTTVSHKSGY
jgi:hypothetical protein